MDHLKIEIGLRRFEAFTIIGSRHDSSVHESVAGALVWLSGRFIASVMSTEVEVLNCMAAIVDVDAEEVMVQWHGSFRRAGRLAGPAGQVAGALMAGSDSPPQGIGPGRYNRSSSGLVRCRSWIAVRCASNAARGPAMITTSFVRSRRQATDGDGWAADHHEIRMPGPAPHTLGEETVTRSRRRLGADHFTTLFACTMLAFANARNGDAEQGRALGEDTMERARNSLGPDHPITLVAAATISLARLGATEQAHTLAADMLAHA